MKLNPNPITPCTEAAINEIRMQTSRLTESIGTLYYYVSLQNSLPRSFPSFSQGCRCGERRLPRVQFKKRVSTDLERRVHIVVRAPLLVNDFTRFDSDEESSDVVRFGETPLFFPW